ncbi:hypothetical protein ACROYT_G040319 [Oculina patagonica]
MSGTRKDKRKTAPALKYGEAKYFLVQFIEDNIKTVVLESQVIKEDNGTTKAMFRDKQYYPCVVLSESEDKEQLIKTKNAMDGISKKKGAPTSASTQKEKPGKQSGKKTSKTSTKQQNQPGAKKREEENQEKSTTPKGKTKEQKEADAKKKEEEKKERVMKKKALDERDLNILSQLTQLNKSVVVIDEPERDREEKEKELQRKKQELERREKEVSRKEKRKK